MPVDKKKAYTPKQPTDFTRPATAQEVAWWLRVSVYTVYDWRRLKPKKGPKAMMVGGRLLYDWAEVKRWAAEHEEVDAA